MDAMDRFRKNYSIHSIYSIKRDESRAEHQEHLNLLSTLLIYYSEIFVHLLQLKTMPLPDFQMFANRLTKMQRHLKKWTSKQGITCYRVYDADIPEFPLAVDLYEKQLHVAEYQRRFKASSNRCCHSSGPSGSRVRPLHNAGSPSRTSFTGTGPERWRVSGTRSPYFS